MLFKPEHKQMILEGRKTQTRRIWKKPMVKVGGIYKAKLKLFSKKYFARVRVLKLFKQKIGDISLADIRKEGYNTLFDFKEVWIKINKIWNPNLIVDVVEFEVVK